MKRLKYLGIYTVVVIVLCFFFRNHSSFASSLYLATGIALLLIAGLLFGAMTNQSFKIFTSFDEIEKSRKEKRDVSFKDILTYLYLIVPFIISIILFAN